MRPLTTPELAALPADTRAGAACEQYLKFCIQRGVIGRGEDTWEREKGFAAGWNMATDIMVWLHMAQASRAQKQANEQR
ncbi:MAG: hypothetical protein ABIG61_17865 [Planctomycetota bacterium]